MITRLRTGHICTWDQLMCMGWDIGAACGSGAEIKKPTGFSLRLPFTVRR